MNQSDLKGTLVLVTAPAHPDPQDCWVSCFPAAVFGDGDAVSTVLDTSFR